MSRQAHRDMALVLHRLVDSHWHVKVSDFNLSKASSQLLPAVGQQALDNCVLQNAYVPQRSLNLV